LKRVPLAMEESMFGLSCGNAKPLDDKYSLADHKYSASQLAPVDGSALAIAAGVYDIVHGTSFVSDSVDKMEFALRVFEASGSYDDALVNDLAAFCLVQENGQVANPANAAFCSWTWGRSLTTVYGQFGDQLEPGDFGPMPFGGIVPTFDIRSGNRIRLLALSYASGGRVVTAGSGFFQKLTLMDTGSVLLTGQPTVESNSISSVRAANRFFRPL